MPHPSGPQSTPDSAEERDVFSRDDRAGTTRLPRRTFALVGPSRPLDLLVDAVRPDVADVRLADRVFAPHYAAPLRRIVSRSTSLREGRGVGTAILTPLGAGTAFDLLDLTGGIAWGIALDANLVGYLDADDVAPQ